LRTSGCEHPLSGVWGNVATIVAGALFVVWPLQYRWSMTRIRARLAERGGHVERFETLMGRRVIRVGLVATPLVGVLLIADGVVSLSS
jgi:hypothetical protein